MSVSVTLKLKTNVTDKYGFQTDNEITFNQNKYIFARVLGPLDTAKSVLSTKPTCWFVVGPLGSGKTTALQSLLNGKLHQLASSKSPIYLSAVQVCNDWSTTDLLQHQKPRPHQPRATRQVRLDQCSDDILSTILARSVASGTVPRQTCLVLSLKQNGIKTTFVKVASGAPSLEANPHYATISSIARTLSQHTFQCGGFMGKLISNNRKQNYTHNLLLCIDPNENQPSEAALCSLGGLLRVNSSVPVLPAPNYTKPTLSSMSPKRREFPVKMSCKRHASSSPIRPTKRPAETPEARLKAEIEYLKAQLAQKDTHISQLTQTIHTLTAERRTLVAQWSDVRDEFSRFKAEHELFIEETTTLKRQLSHIASNNAAVTQQCQQLLQQLAVKDAQLAEAHKLNDSLTANHGVIVQQYETRLESTRHELSTTTANLTEQLVRTREKLDSYNGQLHALKQLTRDKEHRWAATLEATKTELRDATDQLDAREQQLDTLRALARDTVNELTRTKHELEMCRTQLAAAPALPTLDHMDYLDQFTNLSESMFSGHDIYEDPDCRGGVLGPQALVPTALTPLDPNKPRSPQKGLPLRHLLRGCPSR
jgi:hypothetical protein